MLTGQIATAASESHWHTHLSTLLQITSLRRQIYGGRERYPFLIWWLCMIDLEAIFSSAGSGEFVSAMLKSDLVPPPSYHLFPLGQDGSSIVYGHELETLPIILQLDYEVTTLAMRLGLLAHELRSQTSPQSATTGKPLIITDPRIRHARVYELVESLRELWATLSVNYIAQHTQLLPARSAQLFDHAQLLYRACVIYSHTSMWAGQRLETSPDYDTEISVAASQILNTAARLLKPQIPHTSTSVDGTTVNAIAPRFLVFPLFMAGIAATDGSQKLRAAEMLEKMEFSAVGRNTGNVRKGLERVYEEQNSRFMMTGQSLDVDWWSVLGKGEAGGGRNGERVWIVNFGL